MINFFRNLLIRLFNVKFVIISIKDVKIEAQNAPNTIYPGRNFFAQVQVPISKVIQFARQSSIKEYVLLNINGTNLIFNIVSLDYIYDLLTGDLVEIVIYSNLLK